MEVREAGLGDLSGIVELHSRARVAYYGAGGLPVGEILTRSWPGSSERAGQRRSPRRTSGCESPWWTAPWPGCSPWGRRTRPTWIRGPPRSSTRSTSIRSSGAGAWVVRCTLCSCVTWRTRGWRWAYWRCGSATPGPARSTRATVGAPTAPPAPAQPKPPT
ncbi:hypothetical protein V2I01_24190 [Micromonospora sp. BRA006-A]|nr:hypothetical protein [Micromonospora sp. BRA006-A]